MSEPNNNNNNYLFTTFTDNNIDNCNNNNSTTIIFNVENNTINTINTNKIDTITEQPSNIVNLFNNTIIGNTSNKRLQKNFYYKDCETLAKDLLGKVLIKINKQTNKRLSGRIIEVEAYLGGEDKASHTYLNKKTNKNKSMYLPAGYSYIYKSFRGGNNCFNINSDKKEGIGAGVLIRSLEPLEGFEEMKRNRLKNNLQLKLENLTVNNVCAGPARLCQAFNLTREEWDGIDMCSSMCCNENNYNNNDSYLFLEEFNLEYYKQVLNENNEIKVLNLKKEERLKEEKRIIACPRVNIDYSEEWKDKLLRFCLLDKYEYVSYPVSKEYKTKIISYVDSD